MTERQMEMFNDISNITKYDIEVLKILNGEDVPGWTWGAAMSSCCEFLKATGFAKGSYEITEKGKQYLEELDSNAP